MTTSSSNQMPTRAEARRLVGEIAKDHGYLGEDVLGRMDQDTRREVEEALLKKDLMIGSSVITLAQNLYTSNARFVFELLQNADDNHYTRLGASRKPAYVSFHIYADRIVVENNEDGFTQENLRAICNIGKSSKTGAQGYIGEKGIGFKSVFMAARKAHIQSGNFSFYFLHRKGDSGMGMISPVWQDPDPDQDVNSAFTKITLFLHDVGDHATIAAERETIKAQFHELKHTVLLFLKNINCIKIVDHDHENNLKFSAATYYIDRIPGENIVTLHSSIVANGEATKDKQNYYVISHTAANLARSENRTYSVEEEASRAYARAEVILAFQLSDQLSPIVVPQEVFAFLPIKDMGFSFLIQSDFVTQANRQDIVTTSRRNLDLLDGIADAFVKAVRKFCEERHPTLQYRWMRYLPDPDAHFAVPFWKTLVLKIKDRLDKTPVLRPRSEGSLKLIRQLERISGSALDLERNPLFDDIEPEAYLSSQYQEKDLEILKPYGLAIMCIGRILARVKSDLKNPRSKMKSPTTSYIWHSRAAKLLLIPLDKSWVNNIEDLKTMDLLPLHSQRWVSIKDGSVYYTRSEGIEIPRDLGLKLVDQHAASHQDRKALFDQLGVREATADYVRNQILQVYMKTTLPAGFDLSRSLSHLNYLYVSHRLLKRLIISLEYMQIYNQDGILGMPHSDPFYISDDERYGVRELVKVTEPGNEPGASAPGFKVNFLHNEYLKDPPKTPAGYSHSWKEWLFTYLSIQRNISLTSINSRTGRVELSEVCKYLAEHRPEIFVGALKYYWKQEKAELIENRMTLMHTKVLCRGANMIPLRCTYLPTFELERRCARFLSHLDFFPFLLLEEPLTEGTYPSEWIFLYINFGVGKFCDLDFYLTVLGAIGKENESCDVLDRSSKVYNLYEAIHAQCLESDDREASKEKVRKICKQGTSIFVPACGTSEARWVELEKCLWNAPSHMETRYPLQSLYQVCFTRPKIDENTLTQFFTNTLKIPNGTWRHFLDEIKHLSASHCTDFDRINDLYTRLNEMIFRETDDDKLELKQTFEENALIYVVADGKHGWHKVCDCLWASATAIRGKTTLNDHYEILKSFFVTFLGVAELDFDMVLDKLVESTGQESVEEIKETLWLFNSLLQRKDDRPSPARILARPIFPLKYPSGRVELRTSRTEFAIVDRQRYGDAFADKAKLLDFSLDEVRRLNTFLRWTGLESRYLSLLVKEISLLQGGDPTHISTPDRDVSRRAHGLFRIATHYNSRRTSHSDLSLYHLLRYARVFETDGISSQLVLQQDDRDITTEVGRSELHLNEDESGLVIYVPRDAQSQDFCYRSKLPPQLLELIMTEPDTRIREKIEPAAVLTVNNVINANQSTINLILEEAGIIEVEVPDDDDSDDDSSIAETPVMHRLRSVTPQSSSGQASVAASNFGVNRDLSIPPTPSRSLDVQHSRQGSSSTTEQVIFHAHSQSRLAPSRALSEAHPRVTPVSEASYGTPQPNGDSTIMDDNTNYVALLQNIVSAARRAIFPTHGPFNMSAMLHALPGANISLYDDSIDEIYRVRSTSRIERDKKIGAAGELFVFELLSHLIPRLPGFSWGNWQSTIRRYVTGHPDYAAMDAWNGRETADIVYDDDQGVLTGFLIEKGYFEQETWGDLKPRYYIEVKSTTGPCEVPFFMSKYQYQRMQNLSNRAPGSSQREVYIIFRVFKLYSDSIDVQIYMDPDAMRVNGGLIFTAESWSVVPGLSET